MEKNNARNSLSFAFLLIIFGLAIQGKIDFRSSFCKRSFAISFFVDSMCNV